MKRKITDLEQKLLEDGWQLTNKNYTGKHSEKIECYEYHKMSDLRNDGKTFELVIKLDQKRSQIVDYGVRNVFLHYLNDQELCFVRFLFLELKHFVERITVKGEKFNWNPTNEQVEKAFNSVSVPNSEFDERQEITPMTPEQFDELCKENE